MEIVWDAVKKVNMQRLFFLVGSILFATSVYSQKTINSPSLAKDAKVEGSIIDMRTKQPLNNELIVFKSSKNGNEFQAISNEAGKFTSRVPSGDKYEIFIMGFKDSTSYNVLNVPSLAPNASYTTPFTVSIEFDPPKTFVLDNVEFDFGKANLRPESYKALDDLVEYLQRRPSERIELGGYTDNIGNEVKNRTLSLERAKAIVAYLIAKGISEDRLTAKGYGSQSPIEENTTESGRQKNRRTEVKILE